MNRNALIAPNKIAMRCTVVWRIGVVSDCQVICSRNLTIWTYISGLSILYAKRSINKINMDLKEIVNSDNSIPISEEESYLVIKSYIKARKGVDITPRLDTSFGRLNATREVSLMHHMVDVSIGWFRDNQDEI